MSKTLLKSIIYLSCTLLLAAGCQLSAGQTDNQIANSNNNPVSGNLVAQAAQQLIPSPMQQMFPAETTKLLDYGTRPLNAGMSMIMPNTLVGFNQDLQSGASMMKQMTSNGLSGLSNEYDSLRRRLQMMEQSLADQYNNEVLRRMYDLWRNPEEMCKTILNQSQQAVQSAQQQVSQAGQTASSLIQNPTSVLRKLSGFSLFGRR